MDSPRLLISAAHKSSGKTTLTIGLAKALAARGRGVQTFKKGPDYIDPMWLARASGRPCFNLDPHLMHDAEIVATFARHAPAADVCLVEGNKGLYDGLALDGSNSNAALARQLGLPVLLVIDARGMTRGIAPLILGYQAFERDVRIAGVILNQLGGSRHEAKLRAELRTAIEAGLPTYAECGGLMYLARSIRWGGRTAQMVGAIPGDVVMHERPVGRGYVQVAETAHFPWPVVAGSEGAPALRLGHEFHHSSLENLDLTVRFAYEMRRGHGVDGRHDGVCVHNVLASYTHLRHTGGNQWPQRFVAYVREQRAARGLQANEQTLAA